ncbi:lysylphosphatidylglycerol synthase transmembrane domain-containing protein [Oceanirhabdus seepicola]|uniref:Phosphatidylglycerol lysyltransferase n=1 Tax=Oceanirhabdus seepicola TaxID=2828781 RepID=A0A9J6P0H4_9CLOT|nr:lysylphosphatidylglycerol synthase transmembrane domain-containing protein [Oceanirhabdus seepicola]MCM1990019.1 flippase-like domain-containing protein [Oceanirhabdus seepicola]
MKDRLNLIIGGASGLVLLIFISLTKGWGDLIKQLTSLKYEWIIGAFLCMFLYWIFESKSLQTIMKSLTKVDSLKKSFKVTMIGQFFNSVTPFASGGQPAQLFALTKEGIGAGEAGSILMMKYIVYQSVLTVYSIVLIVWKAPFFQGKLKNIFYLSMIGFIVNTGVIIALLIFAKYKKFTHSFFNLLNKLLNKLKIVKDVKSMEQKLDEQLDKFHDNIIILKKNKRVIANAIIYTTLQLTVFFAIPYFVYYSFEGGNAQLINMIAANAFVMMLTAFIPLPGASGGAEGGFYIFFQLFFQEQNILTGILIWRIITFYSCLIFGAVVLMRTSYSKGLLETK